MPGPLPLLPSAVAKLHDQRRQVTLITEFFETLSPDSLKHLASIYAPNAYFKDPFNEIRGLAAVEGIFSHMFRALEKPRFLITGSLVDNDQCFLTWDFEFYFKTLDRTSLQTVRGGSHLKLTADGLIYFHRDYWDAAEELYEKLPVVGRLMRWLKERVKQ